MLKVENRLVRFGQVGSADIVAVKGGKVYFIECKSPTGKLRDSQKMWLQEAEDHGAICIVAHSLEELIESICKKTEAKPASLAISK